MRVFRTVIREQGYGGLSKRIVLRLDRASGKRFSWSQAPSSCGSARRQEIEPSDTVCCVLCAKVSINWFGQDQPVDQLFDSQMAFVCFGLLGCYMSE